MEQLRIYTLGRLAFYRERTAITGFVSRKVEALLVYLACTRREHAREVLGELLWDDLTQERAMGNLRTALSNLQHLLAPYLNVTRYTVALNPDADVWVDSLALENELTGVEQAWRRTGGLALSAVGRLESALELYQGDFLAGFHVRESAGFENWQVQEARRLQSRVLAALHRLVAHALENRTFTSGITFAQRLLTIDPLDEEAHSQLMLLFARSGQRGAALAQYETCRTILRQELDAEPSPETAALYERIAAGEIAAQNESLPVSNLPPPATPFIPRPQEIAKITAQLAQPDCRLLTLVGPGGIGKTRLALQVAGEQAADFRHGACFVDLKRVESADKLLPAIAETMNIGLDDGADGNTALSVMALAEALSDRHLLLILDKFEHILDAAPQISALLARAPGLKLIVTSRERLNIREEWMLQIEGMPFPPDDQVYLDALTSYEAVQLFVGSARRVKADFSLSGNERAVARICALVQGLPLGLELAAAWVHIMPCDLIAVQIEQDLDFLTTSARNITERHRSLTRLFEQSWQALSNSEQDALMRLSVFRGTFTLEAALNVTRASIHTMTKLIEQSLLRNEASSRLEMRSLLARYAQGKLVEAGQWEAARAVHARYYAAWAEGRAGQTSLVTQADQELYNAFELERDNLRAALAWGLESRDERMVHGLCAALFNYWRARGYQEEARRWLEQALALPTGADSPVGLRAATFRNAGLLAWSASELDEAASLFSVSRQLGAEGDRPDIGAEAALYAGYVALRRGTVFGAEDRDGATAAGERSAQRLMQEALQLASSVGLDRVVALSRLHLGYLAAQAGSFLLARSHFEAMLRLYQAADLPTRAALLSEVGEPASLGALLHTYAALDVLDQKFEQVVILLGAASALLPGSDDADQQYMIETARSALGTTAFTRAWEAGLTMTADQALDYLAESR